MSDEAIFVVVLLAGIAGMIVGLVMFQRGREKRLAQQDRIEIAIYSTGRTVLVVVLGIVVVPVAMGVIGATTDPWLRQHALAATLGTIGGGCAALLVALVVTRNFRRTGSLVLTVDSVQLDDRGQRCTLERKRPFVLLETTALGPGSLTLQVVLVTQDQRSWAFSYGLGLGKKPHGDLMVDKPMGPLLDGITRVLHNRLRADATMRPDSGGGPWLMSDGIWHLAGGRWQRRVS